LPDCYFIFRANPGGVEEARTIMQEVAGRIADLTKSHVYYDEKRHRAYVFLNLPTNSRLTANSQFATIWRALNKRHQIYRSGFVKRYGILG